MDNRLDLAQNALKYLEVAEKFEVSKDWEKALENYEIAFEDLKQSGYLSERIDELASRIDQIKKIISQRDQIDLAEKKESKTQLEAQAHSLIDGANKLESEGNYRDAINNLVSAIGILIKTGWSELQLENLRRKAIKLAEIIDKQEYTGKKPQISPNQLTGTSITTKKALNSANKVKVYEEKKKNAMKVQENAFLLIDKANQLERQKKFDEAIQYYQESIDLLNSIGWVEQTRNIEIIIEKIKKNMEEMDKFKTKNVEIQNDQIIGITPYKTQDLNSKTTKIRDYAEKKKEEEKIQERAFYFIEEGKKFDRAKKYDLAINELEKAVKLLETIEWDSYIHPILNYIETIKNKRDKEIEETKKLVKKQQELTTLQEAISSKQELDLTETSQIKRIRKKEFEEKKAERKLLESRFYNLLDEADSFVQKVGDLDSAIEKYNQALELINTLGSEWKMHASTIKTSLSSIEQLKKEEADQKLRKRQELEDIKREEIEFQSYITQQSNLERNKLKERQIAFSVREDEKKYIEMRKDQAFKILDQAQEQIKKDELRNAISSYQNAAKIFAEIQWFDELPLIETSIKKIEMKIKQNNQLKQEKLQKEIDRIQEEKEFQKQIAKELIIEKSKQRQKEISLKERAELQQQIEQKKQDAFNILDKSEIEIRKGHYDDAIDMYRQAEAILNEIHYPTKIVQEMILKIEKMKLRQEKLREKERELEAKLVQEDIEFHSQIAENNIKERERLKQREIIIRKSEERIQQLEKQKERAFFILDEAENLLKNKKYDDSLEKYRKAEIILHQLQFPTNSIKEMMSKIISLKETAELEKEKELKRKLEYLKKEKELESIIEERQIQEREKKLAEKLALQERQIIAQEQANHREIAFTLLEKAKPFLNMYPPQYDSAISLYKQARTILEDNIGWTPEIKRISELIQDLQNEKLKSIQNQKMEEKEKIRRQQEFQLFQEESNRRKAIYEQENEDQRLKYEKMLQMRDAVNKIRDEGLKLIDQAKKFTMNYDFNRAYNLYESAIIKFREIGWNEEISYIEAEIKNTRKLEQKLESEFKKIQKEKKELERKREFKEKQEFREDMKKQVLIDEIGTFADEISTLIEKRQKKQTLIEQKEREKITIEAKIFRKNMKAMINFREELSAELKRAKDEEKKKIEEKKKEKEMKELEDITRMIKKAAKKDDKEK